MSTAPTDLIKQLLTLNLIGQVADTDDWGIYIGHQPNKPDRCITIYDSGGTESNPAYLLDYVSIQIRVRDRKGGYNNAYLKIKECQRALLGIDPVYPDQTIVRVTSGGDTRITSTGAVRVIQDASIVSDRIDAITQIGGIAFMGYDERERPHITLNLRMIIEPAVEVVAPIGNRVELFG